MNISVFVDRDYFNKEKTDELSYFIYEYIKDKKNVKVGIGVYSDDPKVVLGIEKVIMKLKGYEYDEEPEIKTLKAPNTDYNNVKKLTNKFSKILESYTESWFIANDENRFFLNIIKKLKKNGVKCFVKEFGYVHRRNGSVIFIDKNFKI